MLAISNLSFYFGARPLYENANLHIKPKDRIGLIGANGTGKSTLLRLIVGEYTADAGEVTMAKDCTIGFLNQDLLSYQSDKSIREVAMEAFSEQLELQKRIDEIIQKLETEYSDALVEEMTSLQEKFETLEGYTIQAKAEEILEGLGFKTDDLSRPLSEFSGGWRMRVMLAKLLLQKPSILLLDEPTNHLDLPSIQWIENYIIAYEGSIIIVSHDREFLDNTTNKTVEVFNQKLTEYAGNYTFYLKERELQREIQQNAYENQQQKIKQTEQFISRFRAKATKARQVQSRVKMLEKMDRIDEVIDENAAVNFKFNLGQTSGRHVMSLKEIHKAYDALTILEKAEAQIERGDKIALIGANGKGKSTLLRIIAGTEAHQGERAMGHNVYFSFFAQHQLESLQVDNEILQELQQTGSGKSDTELRGVLGCFLFQDEDVFKKIKVLSGGEKSRVALAKVLISEANFLLLDEPTNHLDMQSVNILIQALQQYQGTFVLVSHDRHFISQVANKVWYIENQEIKEYPGTYEEYLFWLKQQETQNLSLSNGNSKPKKEKKKKIRLSDDETKQLKNELRRQQQSLEKIENAIEKLEEKNIDLEVQLADEKIYTDANKLKEVQGTYAQNQQKLKEKNEEWEEIAFRIEEINEKIEN